MTGDFGMLFEIGKSTVQFSRSLDRGGIRQNSYAPEPQSEVWRLQRHIFRAWSCDVQRGRPSSTWELDLQRTEVTTGTVEKVGTNNDVTVLMDNGESRELSFDEIQKLGS
jgi:hypothetical protein